MGTIIDNEHPNRRPDAPVPTGLNDSVPSRSDTIAYSGAIFHTKPSVWGEFPNQVAVTFRQVTRLRTWFNLTQFHATPSYGGNYDEKTIEGVSTATAVVDRWEQSLGVEISTDFGPFSASLSAALTQGAEKSVTVDLYHSTERTIHFNFNKGLDAEVAAWQLDESFVLNNWIYVWTIPGADPSKVTAAMIATAQAEIEQALKEGKKPKAARSYSLPLLISAANQYTLTAYPPNSEISVSRD